MIVYILTIGWMIAANAIFKINIANKSLRPLTKKRMQKQKLLQAIIYFTPAFFLLAFRGIKVGADTWNYLGMFERIHYQSLSTVLAEYKSDAGYYLFNKALSMIANDSQWLLIACAFICILGYAIFFSKVSENLFFCTLGYLSFGLFTFNMSGLRQSIAMVICLFAMQQIEKRSLIKFLLIVALAFTFHASAMFFIPVYFIGIKKNNKLDILIFSGMGVLLGIFYEPITKLLFQEGAQYEMYTEIEETGNGYVFATVLVCILILTEVLKKNILARNPKMSIYINLNYFAVALWIVRLFTRAAERPFLYLLPATIICFSAIPQCFNKKDRVLVSLVMSVLTIALFFFRIRGISYQFCF